MIQRSFLDLDGTVYLGGEIIDKVDVEIRRLSDLGVKFHYMTNNTSQSIEKYEEKIKNLNLPLFHGAIISPTLVLSEWLIGNGIKNIFSVGTDSFEQELFTLTEGVKDTKNPECVIISFDRELNYEKLETACGLINKGIPYYLTHIDLACPSINGPIPDCGAIGELIKATTGVPSSGNFGKPGDRFLQYVSKVIGKDEKVLVAGDRIYTDAEIGLRIGGETVVVCSGEFQRNQEETAPGIQVWDTLAEYLRTVGV